MCLPLYSFCLTSEERNRFEYCSPHWRLRSCTCCPWAVLRWLAVRETAVLWLKQASPNHSTAHLCLIFSRKCTSHWVGILKIKTVSPLTFYWIQNVQGRLHSECFLTTTFPSVSRWIFPLPLQPRACEPRAQAGAAGSVPLSQEPGRLRLTRVGRRCLARPGLCATSQEINMHSISRSKQGSINN